MAGSIWQRRPRLANLKRLGAHRAELVRTIYLETGMVVVIGCLIGAVFGLCGQPLATAYVRQSTGFPEIFSPAIWLSVRTLAIALILAMLAVRTAWLFCDTPLGCLGVHRVRVEAVAPSGLEPGLRTNGLTDLWDYAMRSPSKQTRSKVLLAAELAARGGNGAPDPRTAIAVQAVETLHLASLAHDDVVDAGDMRRGLRKSAGVLRGSRGRGRWRCFLWSRVEPVRSLRR